MSKVSEPDIFPISLPADDDECFKLDTRTQTDIIPKDKIMYKYLKFFLSMITNMTQK